MDTDRRKVDITVRPLHATIVAIEFHKYFLLKIIFQILVEELIRSKKFIMSYKFKNVFHKFTNGPRIGIGSDGKSLSFLEEWTVILFF